MTRHPDQPRPRDFITAALLAFTAIGIPAILHTLLGSAG